MAAVDIETAKAKKAKTVPSQPAFQSRAGEPTRFGSLQEWPGPLAEQLRKHADQIEVLELHLRKGVKLPGRPCCRCGCFEQREHYCTRILRRLAAPFVARTSTLYWFLLCDTLLATLPKVSRFGKVAL